MACLVQSISHSPLWCLLLTMLIIPLSICRPSPSIIFPQIAVLLTREQFLKSLQILYSFSQLLPPFWPGADRAVSPGWLRSGKVPLLRSLSLPCAHPRLRGQGCGDPRRGAEGRELSQGGVWGSHTSPWAMGTRWLCAAQPIPQGDKRALCSSRISAGCQAQLSEQLHTSYSLCFRLSFLPQACHGSALRAAPSREKEPVPWVSPPCPAWHGE